MLLEIFQLFNEPVYRLRSLKSGELFLALSGENFDGFKFLESALKKGAVGAICERDGEREEELNKLVESFPDKFFVLVENSLIYFQESEYQNPKLA